MLSNYEISINTVPFTTTVYCVISTCMYNCYRLSLDAVSKVKRVSSIGVSVKVTHFKMK